jgi:hypothetical protein
VAPDARPVQEDPEVGGARSDGRATRLSADGRVRGQPFGSLGSSAAGAQTWPPHNPPSGGPHKAPKEDKKAGKGEAGAGAAKGRRKKAAAAAG